MQRDARGAGFLVVLAVHCVAEISSGPVACDIDGHVASGETGAAGGRIIADTSAGRLRVFTGADAPSRAASPAAARGMRVYRPDTASICGGDLAVMRLDRPVTEHAIAPIRIDGGVKLGDRITVAGYGRTESGRLPGARHRREDLVVLRAGPTPGGDGLVALPAGTFEVGEGPCFADSGGPAFDSITGALVGVFSGGGDPRARMETPASPCLGLDVRNRFTGISSSRALVLQAFRDSGYLPWLEGELPPLLAAWLRCAAVALAGGARGWLAVLSG